MRHLVVLAVLGASMAGAEDLYVTITRPPPGVPVFGEVEIAAEVVPEDGASVELFVDGRFVDRRDEPPFAARVDVGEESVEHRFEAVARRRDGAAGSALLVTPALRVDEAVELRLRQLYVTVSRGGERVLDLARDELEVLDDGEPQRLVTFERGDVPLTALLLVDASASMRGAPLAAALAGAEAFVRAMQPLDRAQLLLFADRVIHATPSTGFAAVLAAGLRGAAAEGGTAINDHLYLALRMLDARQGRRVIVLLSDGVDVASVLGVRDVAWAARRSQALVYWIRLGAPDPRERHFSAWRDAAEHRAEREGLAELVAATGGRVVSLAAIDEAAAAFAGVLAELREQYVLGYYPTREAGDGEWHDVKVRVTRPGLAVRVRDGYLDDLSPPDAAVVSTSEHADAHARSCLRP
ncbi:MAG TPA: VWA domain-containing protein [Thermoanaerobaculia bacterium]